MIGNYTSIEFSVFQPFSQIYFVPSFWSMINIIKTLFANKWMYYNKTNNLLVLRLKKIVYPSEKYVTSPVAVLMHLQKEFGSKSFETRCWNEAGKYCNNLSKGTTAENLDQGEAKLRRMNSWQTCSSFLLCFSQIFLKLRTVTNCPSKMRLIRIVGPLYSHHLVQRVYEVLFQYLPNVFRYILTS